MFNKLFGKPSVNQRNVDIDRRFVDGDLAVFFGDFAPGKILAALDDWTYLSPSGTVIAVTAFGDMFLATKNGKIDMLDTLDGVLKPVADSADHLLQMLVAEDVQEELLLAGFVLNARNMGKVPGPDQVYDFTPPPSLGGAMAQENLDVLDFSVKLSIAGQLHQQIKDLPPGTRIGKIEISD